MKKLAALALMIASAMPMPLQAANHWSPGERFVAALKVRDLAMGLNSVLQEPSSEPSHVEEFLDAKIEPITPIDAQRGGQMLFLRSMADAEFGKDTAYKLNRAGIGGPAVSNRRSLQNEVIGIDSAIKLEETLNLAHTSQWAKELQTIAFRKLAQFEGTRPMIHETRGYLNRLFDNGRGAKFNGEEIIGILGRDLDPQHYGFDPERGFGLLRTSTLIDHSYVQALADKFRASLVPGESRKWRRTNFSQDGTISDNNAGIASSDFDLIRGLKKSILTLLLDDEQIVSDLRPHSSQLPSIWYSSLFYIEHNLPIDIELHLDPICRRILLTLFSLSDPPASTFYVDKDSVFKVPSYDSVVFTRFLWHAAPTFFGPRLRMTINEIPWDDQVHIGPRSR